MNPGHFLSIRWQQSIKESHCAFTRRRQWGLVRGSLGGSQAEASTWARFKTKSHFAACFVNVTSLPREIVTGQTLGQRKSAGLCQPQCSYTDLHLVHISPVLSNAAQQPPQCPFLSLSHVNTSPLSMKTGRELKLSSALVYLCCFNYWHFPWLEQQTWTISLLGLHVQLSHWTIWLSTVGECFVKNTQHRLLLWEQKYSSNGSKVAVKSDLTNSCFTQKHTQLKKAL